MHRHFWHVRFFIVHQNSGFYFFIALLVRYLFFVRGERVCLAFVLFLMGCERDKSAQRATRHPA
jgi:hypothetical protein